MRVAAVNRKTRETEISVEINLDGQGRAEVTTGIGFLKHMIDLISHHSMVDIQAEAAGDLVHHTVEDMALTLGQAMNRALGDRTGIVRFGYALIPLDDALAYASVDLARRAYSVVDFKIEKDGVEDLPREDIYHFVRSLATAMEANIHIVVQYGENDHHKVESGLKAFAVALRQAVSPDPGRAGVPSSKGVM
jgi:imidazoleglycerol-phosphate dehydratase